MSRNRKKKPQPVQWDSVTQSLVQFSTAAEQVFTLLVAALCNAQHQDADRTVWCCTEAQKRAAWLAQILSGGVGVGESAEPVSSGPTSIAREDSNGVIETLPHSADSAE